MKYSIVKTNLKKKRNYHPAAMGERGCLWCYGSGSTAKKSLSKKNVYDPKI